MRRLIAISLMVLAIWTGAEIYDKGVERAFNGLFAGGNNRDKAASTGASEDRSTSHRTADAFQRAYNKSESRVNALLKQSGSEDIASD